MVNEQGPGRLSRGKFFYRKAQEASEEIGASLRWKLHVVPRVGHDYWRMSDAAAQYLYGENDQE